MREFIRRLQKVARHYKAKAVLLAEWKKGKMPRIYYLTKRLHPDTRPHDAWIEVESPKEFFR